MNDPILEAIIDEIALVLSKEKRAKRWIIKNITPFNYVIRLSPGQTNIYGIFIYRTPFMAKLMKPFLRRSEEPHRTSGFSMFDKSIAAIEFGVRSTELSVHYITAINDEESARGTLYYDLEINEDLVGSIISTLFLLLDNPMHYLEAPDIIDDKKNLGHLAWFRTLTYNIPRYKRLIKMSTISSKVVEMGEFDA